VASTDAPFTAAERGFVARQRIAHLGTTYPDGHPHVVPISPVLELDRLAFATERATQKVRNIAENPGVAVCFDEYSEVWSSLRQVIVHGNAYLIASGFEFRRDRDLLYEKYVQYETDAPIEEDSTVIVEVRILRTASWGLD
jgi:nitroimidazol reductase NimA-like FMN-containing flavoprotein (pyridoxamine 5'-phosphate oxidase superfamily)